ncbi:HHL020Wp [Eremothecium sinecaudum]|uniref:HHL020Wp n=1 Tax=Eremothecium sinecaudum TaxID=45286 RepID=A0A0X8HWH1_9SACH|nr:HHL020Wp [Eremothecium sinecaudum]AMD22750.1 HHL020Wp [Eremothecium sinecaudum]
MSKSRFDKKNSQKFAVVYRPHDDPNFYNDDAAQHILVPVGIPSQTKATRKSPTSVNQKKLNEHMGEAKLYGIKFDDSNYDYTQHLKPIGEDPNNSVFIPSNKTSDKVKNTKTNIEDIMVEPQYKPESVKPVDSVFIRGVAKLDYLEKMQDTPDKLRGFRPDMNPALREALEALDDDEYVVNDDIVVKNNEDAISSNAGEDDDIFGELLGSGVVEDNDEFETGFDEWDIENLDEFEEQHYRDEMAQFDKVETLGDLHEIDIAADVRRFKQQQSKLHSDDWDSDDNFSAAGAGEEDETLDSLGELPSFNNKPQKNSKRKDRRKKGAMSDISGFSMSSSAIARTEVMTVLDDQYDQIIGGYENYEKELQEDEENYKPFDMSNERADFENLLDDFLDNYELESGGRKLAKKNAEMERLKEAADEVSKGKLSMKRKNERKKQKQIGELTGNLKSLRL